jgi:hypothetical protein
MLNLLSKSDYLNTLTPKMVDVTETAEPTVEIWEYVGELTTANIVVKYVLENYLVEIVYRNQNNTFDHILLPTPLENNFTVIVVDLLVLEIKGHYLLDLNAEYSLT